MLSVCRRPTEASPPAPLRMERGVITEIPLHVLRILSRPSLIEGVFYFSQNNTDEQNTQGFTETLSQPISQNLTAVFGSNVLWILYAGGLLWSRNSAQKGSVKSVSSVREKTPHRVVCVSSHRVGAFYFSQNNTDEQNTQHSKQVVAPPPSPPPKGRGVITEIPL